MLKILFNIVQDKKFIQRLMFVLYNEVQMDQ